LGECGLTPYGCLPFPFLSQVAAVKRLPRAPPPPPPPPPLPSLAPCPAPTHLPITYPPFSFLSQVAAVKRLVASLSESKNEYVAALVEAANAGL
jgi:hypothetical protein